MCPSRSYIDMLHRRPLPILMAAACPFLTHSLATFGGSLCSRYAWGQPQYFRNSETLTWAKKSQMRSTNYCKAIGESTLNRTSPKCCPKFRQSPASMKPHIIPILLQFLGCSFQVSWNTLRSNTPLCGSLFPERRGFHFTLGNVLYKCDSRAFLREDESLNICHSAHSAFLTVLLLCISCDLFTGLSQKYLLGLSWVRSMAVSDFI